ncbi:hypothetical protein NGF19_01615 [Streptomyces sp. RY43-2]|uniref:Uncharacterized protein n=1 Tax=Streptomyces macrolidinus TaxID=2952607 RepID=A0ABT0Z8C9_9ACTN|nr:hypothetical protein [Streptomyces macrolidinus]MCN9239492.1 hypothetical protein [Streptomyces macrolidinus]
MGGPAEPPEGTPAGTPGGGEDEYRSVVFDESFVRAARLQEYSAYERMADRAPAVRRRRPLRRGLSWPALILVMLIAVAFGTALYKSVHHPSPQSARRALEQPRMTVIPLAPQSAVPGAADPEALYAHSPAARFRVGAKGITLPAVRRTAHFSEDQVYAALVIAKDYLVESSLDPAVLTGGATRPVRFLLAPEQLGQFDRSFAHPAADGRHTPTGWLVRFDPSRVELADRRVRVQGTLKAEETGSGTLEVTADHTLAYALRPTGAGAKAPVSLFTVRRRMTFRFVRDDLRLHQAELVASSVQAGPLACAEDSADRLRPLLAGQRAKAGAPAGTDLYATEGATALCGTLAGAAQPKP